MPELFLQHTAVCRPDPPDGSGFADLKADVPRSARRRMTAIALMVYRTLRDLDMASIETVVYQTQFSEMRTLEDYVDGFPTPSPLKFQASIHPSGVEQVFIASQTPLPRFFPLADSNAPFAALNCLHALGGNGVIILAEEKGTWLQDAGLASSDSFALMLSLSTHAKEALAKIVWDAGTTDGLESGIHPFADALEHGKSWENLGKTLQLEWL